MIKLLSQLFCRNKQNKPPAPVNEPLQNQPEIRQRELTSGEAAILQIVQEEYGPQNQLKDVFFTPAREAHLLIKAADGIMITTISLTGFARSVERGLVSEQELRDDWIRDSRSVLARYWESNPGLFRLGSRGREVDLVFTAGHRVVDISYDVQQTGKDTVDYIFYAKSMRNWEYPFYAEPLTKSLKEQIFRIITKILEKSQPCVTVKVEW